MIGYAIGASRVGTVLGWRSRENFETGIKKTVRWYIERADDWCRPLLDNIYPCDRWDLTWYVVGTEGQIARSLVEAAALKSDIVFGCSWRAERRLATPGSDRKSAPHVLT
jgi:hypothetical protein